MNAQTLTPVTDQPHYALVRQLLTEYPARCEGSGLPDSARRNLLVLRKAFDRVEAGSNVSHAILGRALRDTDPHYIEGGWHIVLASLGDLADSLFGSYALGRMQIVHWPAALSCVTRHTRERMKSIYPDAFDRVRELAGSF